MTESITAHEITVTRVFDAPRRLVWDAWTQPRQLAAWWGPSGWTTPPENVSVDLRPGGVMRLTSISDHDGSEMTTVGVLREVVVPERLSFAEASADSWHEGAESTVTFTDLGDGRTEMIFRSTIHTTDELRARAEAGFSSALDRLAQVLS
jgi:uncharacterized protein YndB with AHSA1/START domain